VASDLLTVAGVFAILAGVMVYNTLAASRRPIPAAAAGQAQAAPQPWVGRYVQHEGEIVGQVVAVEGDDVVVRKGAAFLVLPRVAVREQGLDLGVAAYDAEAVAKAGESWKGRGA
jgi:nitrogen fixation protein FixH